MSRTPHNTTVVCAAISRNSRHRFNTCLGLSLPSALGRGMVCPSLGKESGLGRAGGWSDALALPGMSSRMCGLKGGRAGSGVGSESGRKALRFKAKLHSTEGEGDGPLLSRSKIFDLSVDVFHGVM